MRVYIAEIDDQKKNHAKTFALNVLTVPAFPRANQIRPGDQLSQLSQDAPLWQGSGFRLCLFLLS